MPSSRRDGCARSQPVDEVPMPEDPKLPRRDSGWRPSRAIILAALIVVLTVLQTAKMRGWF